MNEQERDDLCDALMKYRHSAEPAPDRFDKYIAPVVDRMREQDRREIERLRGVCEDWGSNYQSWVDATRAAEEKLAKLTARIKALADHPMTENRTGRGWSPVYVHAKKVVAVDRVLAALQGDE